MINMRNYGVAEGRLVRDPVTFENKDGSKKVKLTIAVTDNYKSKAENGKSVKNSQFIQLDAFVPANKASGKTAYDLMHKGDMVGLQYSVQTQAYAGANGETVYTQVLKVETVDLKEPRSTTSARQAKNA